MLMVLFVLLLVFILVNLFGYVIHRILHQKWSGRFNKTHLTHHLKLYPPTNFFSDKYRDPGKDNTVFIFGAAALPLVILPIIFCLIGWISIGIMILILVEMLVLGWAHDYLHDAFHIRNHWLNRFSLFRRWIELHHAHHWNLKKNFGIFTFFFDKLFGSFVNGNAKIKRQSLGTNS